MAVPFLEAASLVDLGQPCRATKFHIALEWPMNADVTFGDK